MFPDLAQVERDIDNFFLFKGIFCLERFTNHRHGSCYGQGQVLPGTVGSGTQGIREEKDLQQGNSLKLVFSVSRTQEKLTFFFSFA